MLVLSSGQCSGCKYSFSLQHYQRIAANEVIWVAVCSRGFRFVTVKKGSCVFVILQTAQIQATGVWTTVLKPWVWHFGHCHLGCSGASMDHILTRELGSTRREQLVNHNITTPQSNHCLTVYSTPNGAITNKLPIMSYWKKRLEKVTETINLLGNCSLR